jgi:hypothetical protein
MNDAEALGSRKRLHRIGAWLSLLYFLTLGIGLVITLYKYPSSIGPEQPIPFSHRVHAGSKKIGCLVCHPETAITSTGGIPPLTTCMQCHSRIITSFAPIKDLHRYYEERKPVEWQHVTKIPEFAYFPHFVHLARGIDCSQCHGNVRKMDRVINVNNIDMGFCISCHRKNSAPVDCFTCHR